MVISISAGYTFGTTELVTATKLDTLISSATVSGAASSATASFTNANLTAGVYTFNHALAIQYVAIFVFDNNGLVVTPDDITATDTNNAAIDLSSFGSISGTWNVRGVA